MSSLEGRAAGEAVGLIAKAAKAVLHDAVGPAGRGAAHAAEESGGRTAAQAAAKDAERELVPLGKGEIDRVAALPKGERPDPASYLPKDYVDHHLAQFDDGATRFMNSDSLNKYGISQTDGTSFVMSKSEVDDMVARTGGDPRAMERELGLPEGFFDGPIKRVDIDAPGEHGLRMPSGNEAGANDQWIPGGMLPNGVREAVIDGKTVPADQISVHDFP